MSDEIDITQRAGKESTQIGVQNNYNSALSVEDIVETAFILFREQYPKLRAEALAEVRKLVEEEVAKIDIKDIVSPRPKIVAEVLQNASTTEETVLREMYAKVLSGDMNKSQREYIHPAYAEIIKQLCADEAKILQKFSDCDYLPTITLSVQNNKGEQSTADRNFSDVLEEFDGSISLYFDNLQRLGLVKSSLENEMLLEKKGYVRILQHSYMRKTIAEVSSIEGNEELIITYGFMKITDFGRAFCKICLPS